MLLEAMIMPPDSVSLVFNKLGEIKKKAHIREPSSLLLLFLFVSYKTAILKVKRLEEQ